MKVFKNGAPAGEAYGVDFREGFGVTLTVADEQQTGTTAVTVASGGSQTFLGLSNGSDDTAVLNALLAGGGRFAGTHGQSYKITSPLVVFSNTELDLTGCTVTLTDGSNCNMLVNHAAQAALRTVADAAITSGATTLTSATAAFTSADVGRTVYVAGAATGGYRLVATITAYTNATTVTVSTAAGATVSGANLSLYARDSNITVIGGTWNRGSSAGSGTDLHSLLFRHVDGPTVKRLTPVAPLAGKYFIAPGDCTNVLVEDITAVNVLSSPLQFNGPITGATVRNISGASGDDFVTFTANDYVAYADTIGDIVDVTVENLRPTTCLSILKGLGSPGASVKHLRARGIHGTTASGSVGAVWFGDDVAQASTTGGVLEDVVVEDITATPPNGVPLVALNGTAMRSVRISDWTFDNTANTTAPINIAPSSAAAVGDITIENGRLPNIGATAVVNVAANATSVAALRIEAIKLPNVIAASKLVNVTVGATVTKMIVRDVSFVNATTAGWLVFNNGTITDLIASDLDVSSTIAGTALVFNKGTITSLALGDSVATLTGSSNLIELDAATAAATVTRAVISNVVQSGGGSVVKAATTGHTFGNLDIASLVQDGGAWIADLNTTTEVHLASVTQKNQTSGSFNVRASGAVVLRGGAINTGAATVAGTLRSRSFDVQLDVSVLAKNNGDQAYNTNGALGVGVGPCVSNGTLWKNLYTGATS